MSDSREELLKKALKKTADYLSRRSHSEKELRAKLKTHFPSDLIDEALQVAKQKKWIEDPYELAVQVKKRLDRKNKSWSYIKKYLQNKGLPPPDYDREKEKAKIKNLLIKKKPLKSRNLEEKIKMKQFLSYRMFELDLISSALEEDV